MTAQSAPRVVKATLLQFSIAGASCERGLVGWENPKDEAKDRVGRWVVEKAGGRCEG